MVLLTIVPSIIVAYRMIRNNVFERNATHFIQSEMVFPGSMLMKSKIDPPFESIELTYIGKEITTVQLDAAKKKLAAYHIEKADLKVTQGLNDSTFNNSSLRSQIVEDLYSRNLQVLTTQTEKISELESELSQYRQILGSEDILTEAEALFPGIQKGSISKGLLWDVSKDSFDTTFIGYFTFKRNLPQSDRNRLQKWLQTRLKSDRVTLIIEKK